MNPESTSVDTAVTDTANTDSQAQTSKTFTQDEVNAILAKTKSQLERKFSSKFEELGDPDELREIVKTYRQQQQDLEVKKGNFEKVLQDLASKKDDEIRKRDMIIEEFRVNSPILDAAARYRSVNPEQVKQLVRNQVRLNGEGEVEVLDKNGQVRYDDSGRALTVDALVQEFLQSNPHFVQPTPTTSATRSNTGKGVDALDVSKLDMRNPEDRARYREFRKIAG